MAGIIYTRKKFLFERIQSEELQHKFIPHADEEFDAEESYACEGKQDFIENGGSKKFLLIDTDVFLFKELLHHSDDKGMLSLLDQYILLCFCRRVIE